MNPQSIFHAYAMTYIELGNALEDRSPVPASVVARLSRRDPTVIRATMLAMKDVEHRRPRRTKEEVVRAVEWRERITA